MKTVTFGSGGDYSGVAQAYAAETWDDDVLFLEVGDSVITAQLSGVDQLGATAIIRGAGFDIATGGFAFASLTGKQNGTIIFEYLNILGAGGAGIHIYQTIDGGIGKVIVRYNKIVATGKGVDIRECLNDGVDVYGNHITSSTYSIEFRDIHSRPVNVEDNMFVAATTGTSGSMYQYTGRSMAGVAVRRNYVFKNDDNAPLVNGLQLLQNFVDETFSNSASTVLDIDNRDKSFDSTEFRSTIEGTTLYGIPLPSSTMYTTASQDTNIPDNIIGLNMIKVGYRAAGCFTPPVFIESPNGVSVEYLDLGVKLTWTNNTVTGYLKTNIFWEIVDIESAFDTIKATVDEGVTTYTVPYAQFAASPVWYVRLSHGA